MAGSKAMPRTPSTGCDNSFFGGSDCQMEVSELITTDNGSQFWSYKFEHWLRELSIGHVLTPLYHYQANGGVERVYQILKQGL
jgi:transposase InsO family protein